MSLWCFLIVLLSHDDMMNWNDICNFTVGTTTANILSKFAMVPLDMIVRHTTADINLASNFPLSIRTATDNTASGTVPLTPSKIAHFKAKAMFAFTLNSRDETLK